MSAVARATSLRDRAEFLEAELRARIPGVRGKLLRPLVRFREMHETQT
jgi:hypothetical protein